MRCGRDMANVNVSKLNVNQYFKSVWLLFLASYIFQDLKTIVTGFPLWHNVNDENASSLPNFALSSDIFTMIPYRVFVLHRLRVEQGDGTEHRDPFESRILLVAYKRVYSWFECWLFHNYLHGTETCFELVAFRTCNTILRFFFFSLFFFCFFL